MLARGKYGEGATAARVARLTSRQAATTCRPALPCRWTRSAPCCRATPFSTTPTDTPSTTGRLIAQSSPLTGGRYRADERQGMHWSNLRLIRAFDGGKDELGFIQIHIAMARARCMCPRSRPLQVDKSHKQIDAQTVSITVCHLSCTHIAQRVVAAAARKDEAALAAALNDHAQFLADIIGSWRACDALRLISAEVFGDMWKASSPKGYLGFRTFIMGITGNDDIFPRGVVRCMTWSDGQ